MDCQDYITESVERKKGQHLQREERGAIQHLKNAGYTNRAIARAIGCSPTTVGNELKRGTPPRKSSKGRKPGYSARRGEAVYKANRKRSRKPHRICHCTRFIRWIMEQVKEHKWSLDACVGYARLHKLFSAEEMVCTHTLYNEVWAGSLDLSEKEKNNPKNKSSASSTGYFHNICFMHCVGALQCAQIPYHLKMRCSSLDHKQAISHVLLPFPQSLPRPICKVLLYCETVESKTLGRHQSVVRQYLRVNSRFQQLLLE